MKVYINIKKERPSWLNTEEEFLSLDCKGELVDKNKYDAILESYQNELFGKVFSYSIELEDLTVEEFNEFKGKINIKDLNVIYETYPFLYGDSENSNEDDISNKQGAALATGLIIGKML